VIETGKIGVLWEVVEVLPRLRKPHSRQACRSVARPDEEEIAHARLTRVTAVSCVLLEHLSAFVHDKRRTVTARQQEIDAGFYTAIGRVAVGISVRDDEYVLVNDPP
jgi:hypothetical protein